MKEYKFGNTTVIVHSPLLNLTEDERKAWFKKEIAKENPILENIGRTIDNCYRRKNDNEN